jgi:hemolysin activation/secretion protein
VRVKVTEGQLATLENGSKPPAGTALAGKTNAASKAAPVQAASTGTTNRATAPTFEVRRYEVTGNSVLPQEVVDGCFASALGPKISMDHIRHALGELQLAYRERGYATVAVGLPPQQLTNATIKVKVTEGTLADIRVAGNRYFSSNNVMRALPSLHTNTLLNSRVLQRELDVANGNRDRQVYPTVGPGPEPGTSALTLKVKDRLPVHGCAEVDDYATPGTPDLRMNFAAQYNNLWQREQQLGLSFGFTPSDFKPEGAVNDYFFNRPLISYYGAYYRVPFGSTASVEESINSSVGQFGYNEATHEFRLPPAGARPDLTLYASGSSSSTGIKYGPTTVVSSTPLLTILSQDSGQDVTLSEDFGGRLSVPLTLSDRARFSFSAGADYKNYSQARYNTNNFTIITVVTNAQGSQTLISKLSSPQAARMSQVTYVPLTLGADFSENDKSGSTSASVGGSFNFTGDTADFVALSGSPKASATYGKLNLSLSREQKVYGEWSLLLRGSGQAATGPLISNEQFALGGINSVRGYFEGDEYGDCGWFASVEARTPLLGTRVASFTDSVPTWIRASVFLDYGQCYLLEAAPKTKQPNSLCGAGFGLSANVNNLLDVRIAVGWPLLDSANTQAGVPRAYFTISGQF